ncbi:MAG: response regulator [Bacteroidales bacterium]
MFDTRRTIRWYFKNSIQIWGMLCFFMGGGLFLYNYFANTISIDRAILIIVLSLGMWVAGRIILLATRKEVENELEQLIEYESMLEKEISLTDLIQMIPLPAMLIEMQKEIKVKDVNEAMARILDRKSEEILDVQLNELGILSPENIQMLINTGKISNVKIDLKKQTYALWGNYSMVKDVPTAILLFIPQDAENKEQPPLMFDANFYHNLGHDIFDAINAIIGFTTLLDYESSNPDKKQQYLNIIQVNARKIQWLISNYLQSHFNENYPLRTATDIENLNMLLDDIQLRLTREIPDFSAHIQLSLSKSYSDEEAFLIIDNQLIYQLFLNLFMFLYDDKNQLQINISYDIDAMHVKFIVKVTSAFPLELYASKVAALFKASKTQISYPQELNLHIFKKIIQYIGGQTEVILPNDDTTIISFTVPAQAYSSSTNSISNTLPVFDKTILSDKHILVVEDIDYNRMLLKEYLTDTGAIIHFASTGQEALELCRLHPYMDVILLDIQLPDTDGFQLIDELKKNCPHVVVIAQTAYTSVYDKKRALEAGFNFYLSKPLKQDILLKALTRAVQKHVN